MNPVSALGLDHPDQHGHHVRYRYELSEKQPRNATVPTIPLARNRCIATRQRRRQHLRRCRHRIHQGYILAIFRHKWTVGSGSNVMIAGFMVWGSQSKTILVRALGPSSRQLWDPERIERSNGRSCRNSWGATIATNNRWQTGSQASQISSSG